MKLVRNALALSVLLPFLVAALPATAQAATSATFGPTRITGIPAPETRNHKVVLLRTIQVAMTAGQTAYIYASMRAYQASHVTLVDNEVRCSGAGVGNVVMGENIDPVGSPSPDRQDITIVTRFLASANTSGTLTCSVYYRGNSLYEGAQSAVTVQGEIRFASANIGEDASGVAMQHSLPPGNITLDDMVRTPDLDRTLAAGHTKVDVIADVEFMSCYPVGCPNSWDRSNARFTLYVSLLNGDTVCATATPARTDVSITRQTHHKAVPLYTTVNLVPGCRRLVAYVKAEYLSGYVGSIQGRADGLTDNTGPGGPTHNSVMTHMFAVGH
jgi:hypothetical protein